MQDTPKMREAQKVMQLADQSQHFQEKCQKRNPNKHDKITKTSSKKEPLTPQNGTPIEVKP